MELLGILALVVLVLVTTRQQRRMERIERELAAIRELLPRGRDEPHAAASPTDEKTHEGAVVESPHSTVSTDEPAADTVAEEAEAVVAGPWGKIGTSPTPETTKRPDIETALGTRWAVWVGGLALALGGIFMVRYSIEAGYFGPRARLIMAGLFGLALAAGGEIARRTGFKVPVEGLRGAHVPGILTAASSFTLFGAVYAAHGIYGFVGSGFAFALLGLIGLATVAAALLHGKALAVLGLVGSFATPVLVASEAPNPWALFVYLAIILVATSLIARWRNWGLVMALAFAGAGLWCVVYLVASQTPDLGAVAFISGVTLAVLAFVWLGRRAAVADIEPIKAGIDGPSFVPALLVAVAALFLGSVPDLAVSGGTYLSAALVVGLVLVAAYRHSAIALLHASGVATLLVYLFRSFGGDLDVAVTGHAIAVDGVNVADTLGAFLPLGVGIGVLFMAAGIWRAAGLVNLSKSRAASWAGWAGLAPLGMLTIAWLAFGNIDRDVGYALVAAIATGVLLAGSEWVARSETPAISGGFAVSALLIGAASGLVLTIVMAFGQGPTTVLVGLSTVAPALATRYRAYPVLGWLSAGLAGATLAHIVADPTIVGENFLARTPVFNWLLPGYGLPALAFAFCAWQLGRTRPQTRPHHVMEAAAVLFALLTVAMLVRHAMNGGIITGGAPSLGEQAIYTLIAIGGSAILIALDTRSPSPVFRYGAMVIGVVSVLFIAFSHFIELNPLFTNASTGKIPFFNVLFLAYLLPAAAMGALALYARRSRPRWYVSTLAVMAAVLAFAYATLSVRRIFQGEFIGTWKGMTQLETYCYSALWLAVGVALLALGTRLRSSALRIASAVLVVVAVAKAFLFDMSQLEGFLRALSFIGLGAVLIGIGLFYQRMLVSGASGK